MMPLIELFGRCVGRGHAGLDVVHNFVLFVGCNSSLVPRLNARGYRLGDLVPLVELLGSLKALDQVLAPVFIGSLLNPAKKTKKPRQYKRQQMAGGRQNPRKKGRKK